ncbi:MAG: DUF3311 domain-containing protein [Halobacteriota archaeon]|uniref:DUF3311 domain-containing protein n=1 Tax=Natronomonas sp. TaxID=2184060 RepID=UPI003976E442
MVSKANQRGWAVLFGVLLVFAIPWFLWGDARTALGLPLWLWWHIGWMALASVVFWQFTKRAWGVWIVDERGERA